MIFFIVGDMFDISKTVISNSINFKTMLQYFENIIPFYYVKYILPISNLLSVFITVGLMMRNNELIALRACGLSPWFIFRPIIIFSVILTILSIALSLEYVPRHKHRARNIKNYQIKLRAQNSKVIYDLFLNIKRDYTLAGEIFHYDESKIDKVSITKHSGSNILERLDAELCRFENNQWILYNGTKRVWIDDNEEYIPFETYNLTLNYNFKESPEDIFALYNLQTKDKDELSFTELRKYVVLLSKSGFSAQWALTDLYYMFSFPFSNLILALFGLPIAIHSSKTNIAYGFGLSLMICFGFWISTYICVAFGHRAILNPFIATNITNFIFLGLSIFLDRYLKNKII